MPVSRTYDLVVIGGGSAGLTAARLGRLMGASTCLVERGRLGGDCLWTGCVPSKSLIAEAARGSDDPFAAVRVAQAVIEPHDGDGPLRALGVDVLRGDARFVAPRVLEVAGERIRGRRVVIATGSSPSLPPVPGLAEAGVRTTDDVWELAEVPARLAILGAGPIGIELGQAFARLGSTVTVLERAPRAMPGVDEELAAVALAALTADGVRVLTGVEVSGARRGAGAGSELELSWRPTTGDDDAAVTTEQFDEVLVAAGRRPNTGDLGLDAAGVTLERGAISTDRWLRTGARGVFAAGDVRAAMPFTNVAGHEAAIAVRNALAPGRARVRLDLMPWAVFSDPQLAQVGLSPAEARERHGASVVVHEVPLDELDRAVCEARTVGFVRLVTTRRGRLVGAQVAARHAGEMIAVPTVAMRGGMSVTQLASAVLAYPTWSEGAQRAAMLALPAALAPTGVAGRLLSIWRRLAVH